MVAEAEGAEAAAGGVPAGMLDTAGDRFPW